MLIKSLCVALSTYSVIPVAQFVWDEESTKYSICFFPVVGLFCAVALAVWTMVCQFLHVGGILFAAVAACLPLLITGGIHMDGFMDTVDALASHQPRERKLEIMKDHHCGAFAVIYCCIFFLLTFGLLHEVYAARLIGVICPGFVLSRALSALCALHMPNARKSGMLAAVTASSRKRRCTAALVIVAAIACAAMIVWVPIPAAVSIVLGLIWVWCYGRLAMKQFGGVTGDTAGFFLQMFELVLLCGVWLGGMLL